MDTKALADRLLSIAFGGLANESFKEAIMEPLRKAYMDVLSEALEDKSDEGTTYSAAVWRELFRIERISRYMDTGYDKDVSVEMTDADIADMESDGSGQSDFALLKENVSRLKAAIENLDVVTNKIIEQRQTDRRP